MVIGSFFYVLISGLSYSSHGARRAAQAEAVAAQTQLATLRSQLQPHFLFNSLHTIVQLIHIDPRRAAFYSGRTVQILKVSGAGGDHPVMAHVKESRYLKAVLCRVL